MGSKTSEDGRPESLRTLPHYMGDFETKSEVRRLPLQQIGGTQELDTQILMELLSTPVKCIITLAELLKLKPSMWTEVGRCLDKFGVKNPLKFLEKEIYESDQPKNNTKSVVQLNKVGEYCEGDYGNTTLPIKYKGVETKAILVIVELA